MNFRILLSIILLVLLIYKKGSAEFPPLTRNTDTLEMMLKTAHDDTMLCRIHMYLFTNYIHNRPDDAFGHARLSLAYARLLRHPLLLAKALNNMGLYYRDAGKFAESMQFLLQSFNLSDSLKDKAMAVKTLTIMHGLYTQQHNFIKAAEIMYQAIAIIDTLKSPAILAPVYNALGDTYRWLQNYDSSSYYYKKTLALADPQVITYDYGSAVNGLGMNYFDKNEFKKSAAYYEMSLRFARQLERDDAIVVSLLNAGSAYGFMGETEKAYRYLNEALDGAKKIGSLYLAYECFNSLSEVAGKNNEFKKGFQYMSEYKLLGDSIKQVENKELMAEYQTKFETEKKVKEIQLLNKDKNLQRQEISKQRMLRNSFIGGFIIVIVFAGVFLKQRNKIKKGKERSDELLLNILPAETAEELKSTGSAKAKDFREVTVLFTDFKNFTVVSENLDAQQLVSEINFCYSAFDNIIAKHNIEKIKTIGDSYMCAGGLPVANDSNANDTVKAALEIRDFMLDEKRTRANNGKPFFEIRIGCHTGPVVAGIVGIKKFAYDIWGDTVNVASRMESSGEEGKVNISGSTYELVKDKFTCKHRGKITAKNKGEIDMYFIENKTA